MRARWIASGLALALAAASVARADGWAERLAQEAHLASLRETDREARREAARWLGRHGSSEPATPALVAQLEAETDPEVRIAIAEALGRLRDPRAAPALAAPAGVMRTAEREARLRALAAIDDPLARRTLAEALAGPGASIAAPLIAEVGAPMIDELVPLLAVPAISAPVATAIGAIGDARGAEAIAARAGDPEPAVRAAILEALGAIGDRRFVELARAGLADESPLVLAAALRAIARLGSIDDGPAIEARIDLEPAVATPAWRALVALDPARAALRIEAGGLDPAIALVVRDAMLELPCRALVPALVALARDDPRGADALARIEDDTGVRALVALAREGVEVRLPVALALRRGRRADGARELVRAEPDPLRRAWLLAIARDPEARAALRARLSDDDPVGRAIAATFLDRALDRSLDEPEALERAIARETDPLALEAEARALASSGGEIDAERAIAVDPRWGAARAILGSIARPSGSAELDRALLRSTFEDARSRDPRARAAAIEALARRRRGAAALEAAIEDAVPEVRLAAARALAGLERREPAARRLASRLAVEPDPRVRHALREALAGRPPARGEECLVARLERRGPPRSIVVDVIPSDGRWLRIPTLPSGELAVCGLADGTADVRLPP